MKRLFVLLLCLMLALPCFASAEEPPVVLPEPIPVAELYPDAVVPDLSRLVVGSTTQMNGEFFTAMWGNNTADIDVRLLIFDANTVAWQDEGAYGGNMNILTDMSATENTATGDHMYTFTLRDDLKFSDGSPITAKDYVFSVLLQSCKELQALGVSASAYSSLLGWQPYNDGTSDVFSGVRLINDYTFSLNISGRSLPYFYELSLVGVLPYPMAVLAPGCDVRDTGRGAFIEGDFSTALLEKTICDPVTGYRFHPAVTTGAYKLVSYDANSHVAEFEINPYYMGNYQGQMPVIPKIIFRAVKNEEIMTALLTGEINLVNKVTQGSVIGEGQNHVAVSELSMAYYLRAGLSYLALRCDEGLTNSVKVRQALMHSIDPQAMVDSFLLGYGQPVYGMYGYGQWMVSSQAEAIEAFNIYPLDTDAAIALLSEDGFRYDAQGGAYASGLRYNKDGQALSFKMAKTAENTAADTAEQLLRESFEVIGAELIVDTLTPNDMLSMYYRVTDNPYDMMFMASNFTFTFDPYFNYHTDPAYEKYYNTSGLRDAKLMRLAEDMRETAPDELEEYNEKWIAFQEYWISVLPFLPLYSNIYFDFFSPYLENYLVSSYSSWASAIVYADFDDVIMPLEEILIEGDVAP